MNIYHIHPWNIPVGGNLRHVKQDKEIPVAVLVVVAVGTRPIKQESAVGCQR